MSIKPSTRTSRLTAIALLILLAIPPLSFAPPAAAAPGSGWSLPFTYSNSTASVVIRGQVAAGPDGKLFAVWDETGPNVFASTYAPALGWSAPVKLSDTYGQMPAIAADDYGNAFAAWIDLNVTYSTYGPVGAFYLAGLGWRPQVNLTGNSPQTNWFSLDAAMDNAGNGYVVQRGYLSPGPFVSNIGVAMANIDGAVQPSAYMDSTPPASNVTIAALPPGGAIVVWNGGNGTGHVWASVHTPGQGWGAKEQLDSASPFPGHPTVDADAKGDALIVWPQRDQGSGLQFIRYQYGCCFHSAEPVPGANLTANYPSISMTPSGGAVLAYAHGTAPNYLLAGNRYSPDVGWMEPEVTSEAVRGSIHTIAVDADPTGNAMVGFMGRSGVRTAARAVEYTTSGFLTSALVTEVDLGAGNSTANNLQPPFVKAYAPGRAAMAWTDTGATPSTRARLNFYAAADTTPPFIVLDRPVDGYVTTTRSVQVSGITEPGASLSVNGIRLETSPSGSFWGEVPLSEGQIYLSFRATDAAGNMQDNVYIFTAYTDPAHLRDFELAQAGREGLLDPAPTDEQPFGWAYWPALAVGPNGHAVMAWWEGGRTSSHVYATTYAPGSGWRVPTVLDDGTADVVTRPNVAVDAGGNATVTWTAQDVAFPYESHVGYGAYRAEAEAWMYWGQLDSSTAVSSADTVALPGGGFAFIWSQLDAPTIYHLYAQFYTPPFGFTVPARIDTAYSGTAFYADAAVDGLGNIYVVAGASRSGTDSILLTTYTPAGGWDGGVVKQGTSVAGFPSIASDSAGDLTVGWPAAVGETWAARQVQGGAWTAQRVGANVSTRTVTAAALDDGSAAVGFGDSASSRYALRVAYAPPGAAFAPAIDLSENATSSVRDIAFASGPSGSPFYLFYDQYDPVSSASYYRTWDAAAGSFGPAVGLGTPEVPSYGGAGGVTPDGGFHAAVSIECKPGREHCMQARRFVPPDLTAPAISISAPLEGGSFEVPSVLVTGTTEQGAVVTVNGAVVPVALNGSFATAVALVNGTNTIRVVATDVRGNSAVALVHVTQYDPDRRRIDDLEAANAALAAELAAANATLWQALVDQNASLLASLVAQNDALLTRIAQENATLFAALVAQNASLIGALADLNSSLLAELAAGDADLAAMIGDTNASLLAALALQDADLLQALAAQNADLLDEIARTNTTLWNRLTAEDGRLWNELNASAAATNKKADDAQQGATAASNQAAAANALALLGIIIGVVGAGLALMAWMQARRLASDRAEVPRASAPAAPKAPAAQVVADAEVVPPPYAKGRGRSMETQADIAADDNERK